ncbi:MAG: UDP-N-acetylglucosamine 2-epimerase (non-hydrolyzing) [Candidatus Fermentibacteraceae bacterium]|nr:UDP-N-acetylglucosamine 2-epimerase (non-hydrolyzing) [Candidatus Fermentibacteraceae bacterium]
MIDLICGARPNFMKIDPIVRNMDQGIPVRIVHTGQHYDHIMSQSFFDQLQLPPPDLNLEVGSASITVQTAEIMQRYEEVVLQRMPGAVVVVGDVNSTLACSIVAVRYGIPVIHVEAGLRSFDRSMPEEINRVLTDQIAGLLLITSSEARDNLLAEGRSSSMIKLVGNPMIDTLRRLLPMAMATEEPPAQGPYCLVTLHRPSNVDDPQRLQELLNALGSLEDLAVVFPAHPRTQGNIRNWNLEVPRNIVMGEPMTYLQFLSAQACAAVVITDSGGVQEETSVLGVPCVTVRTSTERPVTLELGTNVLCPDVSALGGAVSRQMDKRPPEPPEIPLWDGGSGARISAAIEEFIGGKR